MHTMPSFDAQIVVELLARLVATPSVSSADPALDMNNQAVVTLLAERLETLGFALEFLPVKDRPHNSNLIARIGQGHAAEGLMLAGHTDTVPAQSHLWSTDPFTLTETQGRQHGLGTSDMKGFSAVLLPLLKGLHDEGFFRRPLQRPLTLVFTADEESGMDGARMLMDRGETLGCFGIIGEPTGLRLINRHKGIVWAALKVTGQGAHASRPDLGRNALLGLHTVMSALLDWEKELNHQHPGTEGIVPGPTLNFGALHGGDAPNRVCAQAELKVDLRLVRGLSAQWVKTELEAVALRALEGTGLELSVTHLYPGMDAFLTPPESDFVSALENLLGQKAESVAFGTEGPFFNALGMDTVIFGPGHIDQAHQANEYITLEQLERAHHAYQRILEKFLVV